MSPMDESSRQRGQQATTFKVEVEAPCLRKLHFHPTTMALSTPSLPLNGLFPIAKPSGPGS